MSTKCSVCEGDGSCTISFNGMPIIVRLTTGENLVCFIHAIDYNSNDRILEAPIPIDNDTLRTRPWIPGSNSTGFSVSLNKILTIGSPTTRITNEYMDIVYSIYPSIRPTNEDESNNG
jgi:hypothetical protein